MLIQAVQVKETQRQAFAPCFLGVWRCKNFSSQGLLLGGLSSGVSAKCFSPLTLLTMYHIPLYLIKLGMSNDIDLSFPYLITNNDL